jgi:glutathione synthase/RimK-type ligase-like ATP-grasp enzyme
MTDVLLATCADLPHGEPGGALLVEELAARGLAARWVAWDEPGVDWDAARLVAARSTWDYEARREEFLAWARAVPRLLHGHDVFAWNTDKAYLVGLGEDVPVVPTLLADEEGELGPAIAAFDAAVVKPRVAAGGRGVVVFEGEDVAPVGVEEGRLAAGPWVVQPLVRSVRTEGETSVFVLGGRPVAQVRKVPAGPHSTEIRVHESYGGRTSVVPLGEEAADLAARTVRAAQRRLGTDLAYARVDLLRLEDGTLAVSELEVTEPGLYLEELPGNAALFADLVADRLS